MPNNNTQQPQMQGHQMPGQMPTQQIPSQQTQQGKQEINPEKMLLQMLKDIEMKIEDLSQRVDVLEQGEQGEPQ